MDKVVSAAILSAEHAGHAGRLFALTRYNGKTSTTPTQAGCLSWSEIAPLLCTHLIRADKDGTAFAPHQLQQGGKRCSADVEHISMAVLDYDDGRPFDDRRDGFQGLRYVAYSSFSHTPEHQKYRVVIPFERPVSSADWDACFAGLRQRFPGIDTACKDAARLYYLPSCPPEREQYKWTEHSDGDFLDPFALIADGRRLLRPDTRVAVASMNTDITVHAPFKLPAKVRDGEGRESTILRYAGQLRATGLQQEAIDAACLAYNETSIDPPLDRSTALDRARRFQHDTVTSVQALPANLSQTFNDAGNADLFVKDRRDHLRYCTCLRKWLIWMDGHWHFDAKDKIIELAKTDIRALFLVAAGIADTPIRKALTAHANSSLQHNRLQSMIGLAKTVTSIPVSLAELNKDRFLLGVNNGLIDLRTGRHRNAMPADLITNRANVNYEPDATCPTWLAALDKIFFGNQALIAYFQRCVGYSFTGDISEHVFFFLHGSGSNGKSTVLTVLREIAGDYGLQSQSDVLMARRFTNPSGPTPELARLAGPRIVIANETEDGQRLSESLVKQMTGGDAITARMLHGEPFDFVPQFKLWLAGNHKPVIRGDDHGIWRRTILIPFDRKFSDSEKDKHLNEKLRREYSGILNWVIAGCLQWQQGGLNAPQEVVSQVSAYRSEMDLIQQWLDDCCELAQDARTPARAAYSSFVEWTKRGGHHAFSEVRFGQKMHERGFTKTRTEKGNQYAGFKIRFLQGM